MHLITIEQGSPEWLARRRNSVTSSDAAVLMGCDYKKKTVYELWNEKKQGIQPFVIEKMKRGSELEEHARHWFTAKTGYNVFPAVVLHEEHDWLMTSLDGLDLTENVIVEIKCPSPEIHAEIVAGSVPEYYYAQIQHHMLVTGLEDLYLVSYNGFEGHMMIMGANRSYQAELLCKAKEFYEYLQGDTPPPNEKAYTEIDIDEAQRLAVEDWIGAIERQKTLEDYEKTCRSVVIGFSGLHDRVSLKHGDKALVKLSKVQRIGNVDWEKLCREQGISEDTVERYRKKGSEFWKLSAV